MTSMRIGLVFDGLGRGGVTNVMVALAREFAARGHAVDCVVREAVGLKRSELPGEVGLFHLESMRSSFFPLRFVRKTRYRRFGCLSPLTRYIDTQRPNIVLSAGNYYDFLCFRARARARFKPKLVISQHSMYSLERKGKPLVFWTKQYVCAPRSADAFVAVSERVADDLSAFTRLPRQSITTIYNPVINPGIISKSEVPSHHPWLDEEKLPVFLAAGRLNVQKDFPTLLRAFAQLQARRPSRLIILGEGPERSGLEALAERLSLRGCVDFPGLVDNPYACMARAAAFVLSSAWEGFPLVIAEALACGCPVVSTDCPSGPAEILEDGRYGRLVPVGDPEAMADAMNAVLTCPGDREAGRKRAAEFSDSAAAERYLALFRNLLQQTMEPAPRCGPGPHTTADA